MTTAAMYFFPMSRPRLGKAADNRECCFMRAIAPPGPPRLPAFMTAQEAFLAVTDAMAHRDERWRMRYVIGEQLAFGVACPAPDHVAGIFEADPATIGSMIGPYIFDLCRYEVADGESNIVVLTSAGVKLDGTKI